MTCKFDLKERSQVKSDDIFGILIPDFLYDDNATQSCILNDKGVMELRHFLMSVAGRERGGGREGGRGGGHEQLILETANAQAAI